ncbi:MAG: flavodoxin domain-containing protein [Candidatus Aenigmatarchaeota archaeon]
MKTLVAYASKGGTTEKYAQDISKILKADIVNLRKDNPDISNYDMIIVGFGIRIGKAYKEAIDFLKNDFKNKKVAIFISSLEPENIVKKKYVEPIIESNPTLKPIAIGIFGGRLKLLWKTIDKTNLESAKKWAEELKN